jgi:uncharacterized protein with HEPN domain
MRPDVDYLKDIVEYANDVTILLNGCSLDTFVSDDTLRCAVTYKLLIVGEAAARISDEVKERWSDVPWRQIIGFRNRIVHGYFATNYDVVYSVATRQLPELRESVSGILEEFGEDPSH